MAKYMVAQYRTFLKVCNSCIWCRRKFIHISNCSLLYLQLSWILSYKIFFELPW